MFKKDGVPTIKEILSEVEALNGNAKVKEVLEQFISTSLLGAEGVIIIWTHGKSVELDGANFSETEATWALAKALYKVNAGQLSFND